MKYDKLIYVISFTVNAFVIPYWIGTIISNGAIWINIFGLLFSIGACTALGIQLYRWSR